MKTLILFGFLILTAQAAQAACGTFEVSKGDVKVQPVSGALTAASVGAKICAGDTVISGENARAKIKMEDGNELNISPSSKIVIETYQYDVASNKKKVMLNILRGKVRATTREENMYNDKAKDGQANTFQIRTKSAVAGVRGTDFLTSFDPNKNKMEVVTFRGKVEVGQLAVGGVITKSVFVSVGQKTVVVGGESPSVPKALPSNELMKQNVETRNEPGSAANTPAPGPVVGAEPTDAKREPVAEGRGPGTDGSGSQGRGDGRGPESRGPTADTRGPNAEPRTPASTSGPAGGGSMISTGDLPATAGPAAMPKLPVPPAPPQLPTAVLNNNLIINNTIQNRKATVNINIRVQ